MYETKIVPKAKVAMIANVINRTYEIHRETYKVVIMDRKTYDGRSGWVIVTDVAGIDAIEASFLGNVDNYCRPHGIFTEPINSGLLGVYFV